MICPKCQTTNEESSRFCMHCGEALPLLEKPEIIPEKEEVSKKPYGKWIAAVIAIVIVGTVLSLLLSREKKAAVCRNDEVGFQTAYTAYEKSGKVNKVVVEIHESDSSGASDENDANLIREMLKNESDYNATIPGVKMEYDVIYTEEELKIDMKATLDLQRIPEGYFGSTFVVYSPEWKNMTVDQFKEYVEAVDDVSCQ